MVTHQFLDAFSWGNISGAAWRVTPNISVLFDVGVKGVWGSKVHQIDFQPACIGGLMWFVFW